MTYVSKRRHYRLILAGTLAALVVLMILSSTIGAARISFLESLKILMSRVPFLNSYIDTSGIDPIHILVVNKIRMPRIVLSALVGMGLSVVGACFQGIFKNPMADPYILGTSSGAALGVTLITVTGIGTKGSILSVSSTSAAAFAGAILATFIVYSIAHVGNRISDITLILTGVAISFLSSSFISFLMFFNRHAIEKIIFWTMGNVSAASWYETAVLLPVVAVGTIIIILYARELNVMVTGTETAKSLGVDTEKVKKILLVVSSIITAFVVSVSGIIGFVGLVIPHIARLLLGSDHRVVIPFSALVGAVFMVACDTIARTLVSPAEIPIGVITSLFGAPFFIYLLISNKRKVM